MSTPSSLEAKLVVLGSQGVGKTSLVHRYTKNAFLPSGKARSTVGANFLTTRVHDAESGTTIRLQIWDTAGQERFRSISRLYYRGAHAAILCYDVTSQKSFEDMGRWFQELRDHCSVEAGGDMIVHVVGTKSDVVATDPTLREVQFERCIDYVAEQLAPDTAATPGGPKAGHGASASGPGWPVAPVPTPNSNRSSGFWGPVHIWDCCHEISAKDGEGIEEVFRAITRKLMEQHHRRLDRQKTLEDAGSWGRTPGVDGPSTTSYFDRPNTGTSSFRVGHGDRRRSWMGFPPLSELTSYGNEEENLDSEISGGVRKDRCC